MLGKFSLWKHFPEAEKSFDPKVLAEAHLDFQRKYNLDFIKFSPHQNNFAKIFSSSGKASGVREIENINIERNEVFKFHLGCIRIMKGDFGGPILYTIFSPTTVIRTLIGDEAFLSKINRENIVQASERVGSALKEIAKAVKGAGAGIFFANKVSGIEDYSDFIDTDREICSGAKFGIYHLHGYSPQAKLIIEKSPLPFVSWEDKRITLADVGEKIPVGGIDRDDLLKGDFGKIESEIKSLLAARHDSIIGPNCALRDNTSSKNLERIAEVVRNFERN